MKIRLVALLFFVFCLGTIGVGQAQATCAGSITCQASQLDTKCVGGTKAGDVCKSNTDCGFGGTCSTVSTTIYDTKYCGEGNPGASAGACTAGCLPGAWSPAGGSCTFTADTVTHYGCFASGGCGVASWGGYTSYSACSANCVNPPDPKYSCSNGSCVPDANGSTTDSNCGGSCTAATPPPTTCSTACDGSCPNSQKAQYCSDGTKTCLSESCTHNDSCISLREWSVCEDPKDLVNSGARVPTSGSAACDGVSKDFVQENGRVYLQLCAVKDGAPCNRSWSDGNGGSGPGLVALYKTSEDPTWRGPGIIKNGEACVKIDVTDEYNAAQDKHTVFNTDFALYPHCAQNVAYAMYYNGGPYDDWKSYLTNQWSYLNNTDPIWNGKSNWMAGLDYATIKDCSYKDTATKAAPAYKSCTVQVANANGALGSSATIEKNSLVSVNVTGISTEVGATETERVNVWLEQPDNTTIFDFSAIPFPTEYTPPFFTKVVNSLNDVYYKFDFDDPAKVSFTCNAGTTGCTTSFNLLELNNNLPVGDYKVHCDITTAGKSMKCSGNPRCVFNGGTAACAGWEDCASDTLNPTKNDHVNLTIQCTPNCPASSLCNATPIANGCGGSCPNTNYGAPVAPGITSPTDGGTVTMAIGATTAVVNFTHTNTAHTNMYEAVLFNKDFYDSIINAPDGGADQNGDGVIDYSDMFTFALNNPSDGRAVYKSITGTFIFSTYSGSFSFTMNTQLGKNLVAIVRAVNTDCGSTVSTLDSAQFTLVGNVEGGIYEVNSVNDCSTTSTYANLSTTPTVTITDTYGFVHAVTSWIVPSEQFRIGSVPYGPTGWPVTWTSAKLTLNNPDPQNFYVCASCNQGSSSVNCVYPPTTGGTTVTPKTGANFFVMKHNLAAVPWWQTWSGLVYAKSGMSTLGSTDDSVPGGCRQDANCDPAIIQTSGGPAGSIDPARDKSAGVPIVSGSSTITGGDEGGSFYNNHPGYADQGYASLKVAGGNVTATTTQENYAYFAKNSEVSVPLGTGSGTTTIDNLSDLTATTTTAGEKIYTVNGSLAITLDAGEKITATGKNVVFVNGDMTVTAAAGATNTQKEKLITVDNGNFLAFIVRGNITFASTVGYASTLSTVAGLQTPNVEGVFIADDEIIIASFTTANTADYKFLGSGVFVGWTGVQMQRTFDDGSLGKELHTVAPTETFIYRPDFLINTPEFLKKSQLTWEEIN
ncbi:hypothetical protein KA082_00995 [Candidatus Woesebacteria bacterium]|nr:hypothetical protein [Candidatus Woesebacteria bacterium]